mmetsp:Transcript_6574/g.17083  ORF Transcript_6574/g.17083 Transcript_6574/m.17083 type:complete len:342 (+) Transcript_6574:2-1027(+)
MALSANGSYSQLTVTGPEDPRLFLLDEDSQGGQSQRLRLTFDARAPVARAGLGCATTGEGPGSRLVMWQSLLSLPREAAAAGHEGSASASAVRRLDPPSELGSVPFDKNWMAFGELDRATLGRATPQVAGGGTSPRALPQRFVQSVDGGFTLVIQAQSDSVSASSVSGDPVSAAPEPPSASDSAPRAGDGAIGPLAGGSGGAVLATSILSLETSARLGQLLQPKCARGKRNLHGGANSLPFALALACPLAAAQAGAARMRLGLVHSKCGGEYMNHLYVFEAEPPFGVHAVSAKLPLAPLAFASGLALSPAGEFMIVGYGHADLEARVLAWPVAELPRLFDC